MKINHSNINGAMEAFIAKMFQLKSPAKQNEHAFINNTFLRWFLSDQSRSDVIGVTAADEVRIALPVEAAAGIQSAPQTVTATVDGLGTGVIPDGASVVTPVSALATELITLPTPIPGTSTVILSNAVGYVLQSSAPATVAINGGVGASASSAIAANVIVEIRCASATAWLASQVDTAGAITPVAPAA